MLYGFASQKGITPLKFKMPSNLKERTNTYRAKIRPQIDFGDFNNYYLLKVLHIQDIWQKKINHPD